MSDSGLAIYWQEDMEQYALQQPWNSMQKPLGIVSTGNGRAARGFWLATSYKNFFL